MSSLPKPNHDTVVFFFEHLLRVIEHVDKNMMTASNLATCIGPSMLTLAEVCSGSLSIIIA